MINRSSEFSLFLVLAGRIRACYHQKRRDPQEPPIILLRNGITAYSPLCDRCKFFHLALSFSLQALLTFG